MTYTSLHTPAVKLRNPLILLLTISFFSQTKKRKNNNPEILYMGCNLTNVYVNKHQGCHRAAIYYILYICIWERADLHLRIVSYQLLIRPILHFKWIQLISVHVELVSKGCFLDNQSLKTHLCLVSVFVALRRMLRLFLCCCSEKWKCNLGYDCNLSNLSNKTWLCTSHISKNNKNNESFQLRNSH